jgi:hypothetical protein
MMLRNEIPIEKDELILQSSSCDNGSVFFVVKLKQSGTYLFAAGQMAGFGRKGFLKNHYGWTHVSGDAGDQIEGRINFVPFSIWSGRYSWYLARFRTVDEIPKYRNWGIFVFILMIFLTALLIAMVKVFR